MRNLKNIDCPICNKSFKPQKITTKCCSKKCVWVLRKKLSGYKPGSWKENGYVVIYQGSGKGIKEHIKIMEEHIGRKIDRKNENVHHINGIRDDNRLENLQLMTAEEHIRFHRLKDIKQGKSLFGR